MTSSPLVPGDPHACCDEFAGVSRRGLLRGALVGGLSLTVGSAVISSTAAWADPQGSALAAASGGGSVLVVLSLRGAIDGLNLVVPHGDPAYYKARPRIAVPADQLVARDAMFGLHPAMAPLLPLWRDGALAAVHATGLPAPNRSHFSAMEEVEDAAPGSTKREGWLNRLIGTQPGTDPLEAIALGDGQVPTSLRGAQQAVSVRDPAKFDVAGADKWDTFGGRRRSITTLWGAGGGAMGSSVRTALRAVDGFEPVRAAPSGAQNGASYPRSDLGTALGHVARMVRTDVGTRVITVDHGDWDHHRDQGTLEWGLFRSGVGDLASSLAAFFTDLGPLRSRVTVVAVSEFGRRLRENDNHGTDHGYGNAMLLAGAGVRGGRYHGTWPGLTDGHDADLAVTTDYRSVLSEVVTRRFGASSAKVFPRFTPSPVGVIA